MSGPEDKLFQIAVCVSGGGTNLQNLIDRIGDGRLPGVAICLVLASRDDCAAIDRARRAAIPVRVVNRRDFADQAAFDQAFLAALLPYKADLIVLAGYLSLLGPAVIKAFPRRIINVHPSLIPAFCGAGFYGLKPHEAALAAGVKVSGATVHLVDGCYDRGPIILQQCVPVKSTDTPISLQQRVMEQAEQQILPRAIAAFAANRVIYKGNCVFIEEEER